MDLSSLYSTPGSNRRSKRLGRGESSGKGKTSGKGQKGQMSRKGHKRKVNFEGGQTPLLRRLPKRGFKNPTRIEFSPVNISALNEFEEGCEVDAAALMTLGIVKNPARGGIKILAKGELTVKSLKVKANAFSAAAKAKIEELGGQCEIVI
ncbi:MAG: 50S ribosomal protein L15 [Lentisphaerae bacterium]|jgi:large subunit ribosomal protein L15|nr:50S ribosomal protein L15 [Lentisphaerota bacterium]